MDLANKDQKMEHDQDSQSKIQLSGNHNLANGILTYNSQLQFDKSDL